MATDLTPENLYPEHEIVRHYSSEGLRLHFHPRTFGEINDATEFRRIYLSLLRLYYIRLSLVVEFGPKNWALRAVAEYDHHEEHQPRHKVTIATIHRGEKRILNLIAHLGHDCLNPFFIPPPAEKPARGIGHRERVVDLHP